MSDEQNPGPGEEKEDEKIVNRLTDAQWSEMRARCELGEKRPGELAREYGVSASAVSQHFQRHNVRYGANRPALQAAVAQQVAQTVAQQVAPFAHKRVERIEETKSQHYQYSTWISQEIMRLMVEAKRSGTAVSSVANDIKTLRIAAAALSTVRQERYAVLEADKHIDEEDLPSIEISDLTELEIKRMQNAEVDDGGFDMLDEPPPEVAENDVVIEE